MQDATLAMLGWPEVIAILGVVILVFGASRLPQIGKGLGEGIRNFRSGLRSGKEDAEPSPGGEEE